MRSPCLTLGSTPNILKTDAGSPGRPGTRPGILRRGRGEILAEDHAEGGDAFIADFIRDARHRFAHPQPRAGRFEPRLLAPDREAQPGLQPEIASQRAPAHPDGARPLIDRAAIRRTGQDSLAAVARSEELTSELQSLIRTS